MFSHVNQLTRRAVAALLLWSVLPAAAGAGEVAIRYQLMTAFAGAERANGTILLSVTNTSGHRLEDLTLRLANPELGHLTGPVQESMDLAAGETRRLEGGFVLDVAALEPSRPLQWVVVFSDPQGFAQQAFVRAEAPAEAAIEADKAFSRRPD